MSVPQPSTVRGLAVAVTACVSLLAPAGAATADTLSGTSAGTLSVAATTSAPVPPPAPAPANAGWQ